MKNYSNSSPTQRFDQNTPIQLNQLLFIDETSADLENYLNSSLPETSSATSDQISYAEQELKSSTMNALSKNTKGKFQKGSRKNKFFKSKSLDEKHSVNPSEIPVINEAMKKILKGSPQMSYSKHSPKALKTYSNKHKDKMEIVESFALPDKPFLTLDASYSKEENSIDLDVNLEKDNFNNSIIFGQCVPPDSEECSELNINDEFRRKSYSAIENVLFGERSLETEVKEGFNFEEDSTVHEAVKPSNGENNGKKNQSPTVLLKSLNLNDIHMLTNNHLSLSKNRPDMLLDRWQKYSSKLKITRSHISPKYSKIPIGQQKLRRSFRSNTSTVEFESCANITPKNSNSIMKLQFDCSSDSNASQIEYNFSAGITEGKNKRLPEKTNLTIPQNIDNVYPRRSVRSAQKIVDSVPVTISMELCSLSYKSPTGKSNKKDKYLEVTSKKDGKSKPFDNGVQHEIMNSTGNDDVITDTPSEKMVDNTSPSNSRNLRSSLRSSNPSTKFRIQLESRSGVEHKSIQNIPSNGKTNRNSMQKEFTNLSKEVAVQNVTMSKDDNSLFISAPETSVGISNHCGEKTSKNDRDNINKHRSTSPSKSKNVELKIIDEADTPTRKSNRLKLQSDGNFNCLDQSIEEEISSKNTPEIKNKVADVHLKSASSKENKNVDVEQKPTASPVQVKRLRGRPRKKNVQSTTDLTKTLQGEAINQKLKTDSKFPANQTLICLDESTKTAENYDLKMDTSKNNGSQQNIEENTENKAETIKKNHVIQNNEKEIDESKISDDCKIMKEEKIISYENKEGLIKRKRGRPKKIKVLEKSTKSSPSNKNMVQSNEIGDAAKIIENNQGVNNEEQCTLNNEEMRKSCVKEGNRNEQIGECSAVSNNCENKSKTITEDLSPKLHLCKNSNIENMTIEENHITLGSNIEQIYEKNRKLHNEFQISQNAESEEKSGENIDSKNVMETSELKNAAEQSTETLVKIDSPEMFFEKKLDDKSEILQKTKDTNIEIELKCSEKESDKVHHHSIDEKISNYQKVDKMFSGSSDSLCEKWNSEEKNAEMKEASNSSVTVQYSDFGYDIHRRTSFRKILERVMEASKLEMETAIFETLRNKRCKSLPPKEFHCIIKTNYAGKKCPSADSKSKYLKDELIPNQIDLSKVKKKLDYNLGSKSCNNEFSLRKRAKSMYVDSEKLGSVPIHNQAEESNCLQDTKSAKNGMIASLNVTCDRIDDDPEAIISVSQDFATGTSENMNNGTLKASLDVKSFYVEPKLGHESKSTIASVIEQDIKNEEDLEVKNILSGKTCGNQSFGRARSKSFVGRCSEKVKPRSKSVTGRKSKKRNRSYAGTDGVTEVVKKVYDFKVGDSIWAKIGNYPYWPALVTEDPETSVFKKFKLLRTTPSYHVRFFGDKGKRAWAAYCIPYEGPQDLEKLEGIIQNDYFVKGKQSEKWKRAVEEAEVVKKLSLEQKLAFFDKILANKEKSLLSEVTGHTISEGSKRVRSKSFSFSTNMQETNTIKSKNDLFQKLKIPSKVPSLNLCNKDIKNDTGKLSESKCNASSSTKKSSPMKDSDATSSIVNVAINSVENQDKIGYETRINIPSPKKKIPMKDSSVLACIDDIVDKYGSPNITNSDLNSKKRKTREHKKPRKKMEDGDSDFDLGLELLDISLTDVAIASDQKMGIKSPEQNSLIKSLEQSTSSETPVSSRKASLISPTRTRSRSSLKLEKRRLSNEFKCNDDSHVSPDKPKANMVLSSSPRRLQLKSRTIQMGHSDIESPKCDTSFFNQITTRLPEYKKNLFRGITRERVCQICEEPGDVVKCRGPCNGDFHIKCVENSLKRTEDSTLKKKEQLISMEKSNDLNSQVDELLKDNKQVQISTVMSRNKFANNVILSPINRKIPIMEQFDRKMKELMSQVESRISIDSMNSSSEEIDTFDKTKVAKKPKENNSKKHKRVFKHVTAEDVNVISISNSDATKEKCTPSETIEQISNADDVVYKCPYCISNVIPACFVCNLIVSKKGNTRRQRCSLQKCGRYYHLECLNVWHQTQWSFILHDKRKSEALDNFVCPRHSCHICASENLGFSMGRCPNDKLVKCLRCPATYHNSYHCVPAGTEILTSTQIICPRHVEGNKKSNTLNTIWCFVCSEGGNLICCETCPTSVHAECLPVNLLDDDTYICEDCESGRFPLYDEVVWVKCGTFRWWPAIILFPMEIPSNVDSKPHSKGEFVVKFFGTYNYFWVGRGRTFLYQEGDTGYLNNSKNKIDEAFSRAIKEAADVYRFKKDLRATKQEEVNNGLKPPPYVRIKVNRPVGNVKVFEGNLSNTTPCDCDPKDKSPCGPNSNCLNRILLTECDPEICPAGEKCKNQAFEKREYPEVKPHRTTGRGWGLKTLEPIKKGQFIIEYVGEIIDDEEYQRRITRMHEQKDENYYFLTIDKDRMLDAGPKGNVARFMNHSCQPNCETQKWTVNSDTRVGLFAIDDIPTDTELTFNYNLECVGTEKKICRCGAPNCSGFIGVKPEDHQRSLKRNSTVKPNSDHERPNDGIDLCFICGQPGDVGKCTNKLCLKPYHLECVQLDTWPTGKWSCPSHSCNVCSKKTSRICVLCTNSYCPTHSEGNITHDTSLGFLCNQHAQTNLHENKERTNERKRRRKKTTTGTNLDSSTSSCPNASLSTSLLVDGERETLRSERYRKRTSCFETNIPLKKFKFND